MNFVMPQIMNYNKLYQKIHENSSAYRKNNQGLILFDIWSKYVQLTSPILDVGCGNGKLCDLLCKDYEVIGIDVVNGIYDRIGYNYVQMDATSEIWPFEDKMFSVSLCFDVLEHLKETDISIVLNELIRVSKVQILSIAQLKR